MHKRRAALVTGVGVLLPLAALATRVVLGRTRPGHPYFAGAPLVIAHRGGSYLAPENSLLAFHRSLAWWSADVLELDVHPSLDGEAIVIHDPTVDRTTDGRGAVSTLTVTQLRRLDAGYRFSPDGVTFPFRGHGIGIPTLNDVLSEFPGVRLIVEIKDGRVQDRVWDTIRNHGASHRVLVAAERKRNRRRLSAYPGPVSASAEELKRFLSLHRLHATKLYRPRVDAFQIPERSEGRQLLTERFVREAHAHNLPVHVWTVNGPADMHRLLDWEVDGIVTDRPDLLSQVLHERDQRPLPPGPPARDED